MQKAVPVVQGGEVDAPNVECVSISRLHHCFHAHSCFCCFQVTEDLWHLLQSAGHRRGFACRAACRPLCYCCADWVVLLKLCLLLCISQCTMRKRTGVRRSTLGAATQPITPRESWHSLGGKSLSFFNMTTSKFHNYKVSILKSLINGKLHECLMFCPLQRAQGAEAAYRQVVLCRHRDSHRVERLHGGCGAGWRASSQRGQATAQHNRPYQSHLSYLVSCMVDTTVLVNASRLLIGPLCHGQTPLQSDLADGAWVSGRAVLCVFFLNEFGFYIGDA